MELFQENERNDVIEIWIEMKWMEHVTEIWDR